MFGMWDFVCRHAPPSELEEIESIVGKKIIHRNKLLREELSALNDIIAEVYKSETNKSNQKIDHDAGIKSEFSPGFLRDAAVDKTYQQIQKCCTILHIQEVADMIVKHLEDENEEMEADIMMLQSALDSESTGHLTPSRPSSKEKSESKTIQLAPGKVRTRSKLIVKQEKPDLSVMPTTPMLPSQQSNVNPSNCEIKSSRVRSRIQNARDDKYFSDVDSFFS